MRVRERTSRWMVLRTSIRPRRVPSIFIRRVRRIRRKVLLVLLKVLLLLLV